MEIINKDLIYEKFMESKNVFYAVYDSNTDHKRQLSKGDVVSNCGKKKNGFCLIQGPLEWGGDERDGWVSAQYLRPVTLCPECGGFKLVNIAEVDIDLDTCKKCKGKGYVAVYVQNGLELWSAH